MRRGLTPTVVVAALTAVVAIALLGAIFGIPESPLRRPGRLDLVGTAILSIGLVSLLLAISEGEKWGWSDGKTIGLIVLGAVALVVFVFVELRVKDPLIDVRLFRHRGVWTAHVVALAFGFAMFGTFFLMTQYLQLVHGYTPFQAGLRTMPSAITMMVVAPSSARFV